MERKRYLILIEIPDDYSIVDVVAVLNDAENLETHFIQEFLLNIELKGIVEA